MLFGRNRFTAVSQWTIGTGPQDIAVSVLFVVADLYIRNTHDES